MKKITILLLTFLLLLPLVVASTALADNNRNKTEVVVLGADEVVDDDYLAAGERVEIFGTINGDLYAAGGVVIISGVINGDILAAGGVVTIAGEVAQDVRILGGTVDITGDVGGSVSFGAGEVNISESAIIGGSVVGGAGNVVVSGPVAKGMKVGAGSLTLSNSVGGSVETGVDDLRLTPQAQVDGDLIYWSTLNASIDETASISGTVTKKMPVQPSSTRQQEAEINSAMYGFRIYGFLTALLFGFLFVHFFPKYATDTAAVIAKRPWKSMGYGFLTLVFIPIILVMILVTIVGIPIAMFGTFIYIMYIYLAKFFAMVWVGSYTLDKVKKTNTPKRAFIVGLLVYSILKLIPVVGFFTTTVFLFAGLGASVVSSRKCYGKINIKKD